MAPGLFLKDFSAKVQGVSKNTLYLKDQIQISLLLLNEYSSCTRDGSKGYYSVLLLTKTESELLI